MCGVFFHPRASSEWGIGLLKFGGQLADKNET